MYKDSVSAAQRKNGFPIEGPISAYCIGKRWLFMARRYGKYMKYIQDMVKMNSLVLNVAVTTAINGF